jgi:RNA polymerase sigma-70 factor (ECF subfamily)
MVDNRATILSLVKEDERAAFRLLFETYHDPLLLYCHRLLGDAGAAGDVVQECFISLWSGKRLENFSGDLDRFIFRAARNRSLAYLRDRRRADTSLDAYAREQATRAGEEGETGDRVEALYRAINRLPGRCREVFLAACLDDKSYREVAGELGISVNTVKSQVKHALKFLRENLEEGLFLAFLIYLTKIHPSLSHPK